MPDTPLALKKNLSVVKNTCLLQIKEAHLAAASHSIPTQARCDSSSHPAANVSGSNTHEPLPSRPHLEKGRRVRKQILVQSGPRPDRKCRAGSALGPGGVGG